MRDKMKRNVLIVAPNGYGLFLYFDPEDGNFYVSDGFLDERVEKRASLRGNLEKFL